MNKTACPILALNVCLSANWSSRWQKLFAVQHHCSWTAPVEPQQLLFTLTRNCEETAEPTISTTNRFFFTCMEPAEHLVSNYLHFETFQLLKVSHLELNISSYKVDLKQTKTVDCVTFMFCSGDFYLKSLFEEQQALTEASTAPQWQRIMIKCSN